MLLVLLVLVLVPPLSLGARVCLQPRRRKLGRDRSEAQSCHDRDFIVYQMDRAVTKQYFRWSFTEGEGGNSNGIRLREIKLLYCSC